MREAGLGAAELCRHVNERLGFSAVNRAAIWRFINKKQAPSKPVRAAICEVLGRPEGELFPGLLLKPYTIDALGPEHVRLRGDVRLPPDQVDHVLALVASAQRRRRSEWGELLHKSATDLRLSGNALARRISSAFPETSQDSLNMQVSRYLRGLSYPASDEMRDAILTALEIERESVPPSLVHPFSVRRLSQGRGARVRFDIVVGREIGSQLAQYLAEHARAIRTAGRGRS